MIAYQPCNDLLISAKLTYKNMRVYYERFAPEWDEDRVREQISNLDNWDILKNDEVVGAIRTECDGQYCYLRDLQVSEALQNNGIGAMALDQANKFAAKKGATLLALRVLKVSPAYRFYLRAGFKTVKEDERFYYMERDVS